MNDYTVTVDVQLFADSPGDAAGKVERALDAAGFTPLWTVQVTEADGNVVDGETLRAG